MTADARKCWKCGIRTRTIGLDGRPLCLTCTPTRDITDASVETRCARCRQLSPGRVNPLFLDAAGELVCRACLRSEKRRELRRQGLAYPITRDEREHHDC